MFGDDLEFIVLRHIDHVAHRVIDDFSDRLSIFDGLTPHEIDANKRHDAPSYVSRWRSALCVAVGSPATTLRACRSYGATRPRCRRTSERRRIGQRIAAVGRVIGVAITASVIVVIEAETEARHDAPAAIEIPCVADGTARLGKVLPRNTASESRAGAAE